MTPGRSSKVGVAIVVAPSPPHEMGGFEKRSQSQAQAGACHFCVAAQSPIWCAPHDGRFKTPVRGAPPLLAATVPSLPPNENMSTWLT
jgi:hypothetical protein